MATGRLRYNVKTNENKPAKQYKQTSPALFKLANVSYVLALQDGGYRR